MSKLCSVSKWMDRCMIVCFIILELPTKSRLETTQRSGAVSVQRPQRPNNHFQNVQCGYMIRNYLAVSAATCTIASI